MDSNYIKKPFGQDLQDFLVFYWIGFLFHFPGFPEESLEPQSPSANTSLNF